MAQVNRRNNVNDLLHLSDDVINRYMKLIMARNPGVHIFDTFFYFKYSTTDYSKVRRWTKNIDIFEMTKLLIPINVVRNKFRHWVLICVDMIRKEITFYDSIPGSTCPVEYMQRILTYLTEEYSDKQNSILNINPWKLLTAECPSQENGIDCGIFVCVFAEYLSRNVQFNFTQEHMFSFRMLILYELNTKRLIDANVSVAEIERFVENFFRTIN